MKSQFPLLIGLLSLVLLNGCTTYRVTFATVTGDRLVAQPNHTIRLSLARFVHYDNTYSFPEDLNGANIFALYFLGETNVIRLNAINGSYRFKSRLVKPLTSEYVTATNAVFAPQSEELENGHLKPGPYTLNFIYTLNGQSYTSNFHITYRLKNKTKFVFFWDLANWGDGS
jgi:hypothetical protein